MNRPTSSVTLEIEAYRGGVAGNWQLPAWGHPISQGVMPLMLSYEGRLFPIGTAFSIGRGLRFLVTATHNVREAWKLESGLQRLLHQNELPASIDHKETALWVLYQDLSSSSGTNGPIAWPLETVDAAPPTDVVFAHPHFREGLPTLVNRLSFDLPSSGDRVWSIGYTAFEFPAEGVSLKEVMNGEFDWRGRYAHQLTVVEAHVQHVFVRRFASGYLDGPCFTFDAEIPHGLSGGPVFTMDGVVRGVNAASVSSFFGSPASAASLLFPFLLSGLRFGASMGPLRMTSRATLLELIGQDVVLTDGSEERLPLYLDNASGQWFCGASALRERTSSVWDDFDGYQNKRPAEAGPQGPKRAKRIRPRPVRR